MSVCGAGDCREGVVFVNRNNSAFEKNVDKH
jgi:hypothetical protein